MDDLRKSARSHRLLGELTDAATTLKKLLEMHKTSLQVSTEGDLVKKVIERNVEKEILSIAADLDALGNVYRNLDNLQQARVYIEHSLALRKHCFNEKTGSSDITTLVARSMSSQSIILNLLSDRAATEKVDLEALRLLDNDELPPLSPRSATPPVEKSTADPRSFRSPYQKYSSAFDSIVNDEDFEKWKSFSKNRLESHRVKILDVIAGRHSMLDNNPSSEADSYRSENTNRLEKYGLGLGIVECRLVLINMSNVPTLHGKLPLRVYKNDDGVTKTMAKELDEKHDHVPLVVTLDKSDAEVVQFGRQTYEEAVDFFGNSGNAEPSTSSRSLGYVRLDTSNRERVISRRHAQIKLARVHPLVSEQHDQGTSTSNSLESGVPNISHTGDPSVDSSTQQIVAWVLRDLDSTNGVLVNGVRIKECPLKDGDIISFGGATSVDYGCAVSTLKHRPTSSIFIYRFEVLQ